MSELNLGPPPSKNSLSGFLIAATLLLGSVGFLAYRYTHRVAHLTIPHTAVLPVHTVFTPPEGATFRSMEKTAEDDLYVLVTLHIQNDNTIPVFVKDCVVNVIFADGTQLTAKAMSKEDIATVESTFPKIKPLATTPLEADASVAPGAAAEGMVLVQFPIAKDDWDKRKSASMTVSFYHQDAVTLAIP